MGVFLLLLCVFANAGESWMRVVSPTHSANPLPPAPRLPPQYENCVIRNVMWCYECYVSNWSVLR